MTDVRAGRIVSPYGFTLLELLIVLAITGVLVSIAIPSYQKFLMKARLAEAKIALSAIVAAEQSFAAEQLSYTLCIGNVGYSPLGDRRYFRVGFNQSSVPPSPNCGPNGNKPCDKYNWPPGQPGSDCTLDAKQLPGEPFSYPATAQISSGAPAPGPTWLFSTAVSQNTMLVGAVSGSLNIVADNHGFGLFESVAEALTCGMPTMITMDQNRILRYSYAFGVNICY